MLKHVVFMQMEENEKWVYYEGFLLINASLPAARVLEVIAMFLGGEDAGE